MAESVTAASGDAPTDQRVRWSVVPLVTPRRRRTAALNPAEANTPSTLTIPVDEDGGIDDVAADGVSLTAEQRLVL